MDNSKQHQYPLLALMSGVVAIIGLMSAVITDVIGSVVVNQYNPIADTISDLAAGQNSWIHDTGLQLGAIGIIVCAVGLYFWYLDGLRWKIACGFLILLGIDIIIIAQRNVYGDGVPTGIEIHIYLVYVLGFIVALVPWLLSRGFKHLDGKLGYFNQSAAIVWLILAPIFFFIPDSWNGAYERFLSVLLLSWLISLSVLLIRYGWQELNDA